MNNMSVHGGYDAKNKASLDNKYRCPICQLIYRNSVQLICGHRICQSHLPHEDSTVRCPQCSETTMSSKALLDKGFNNDMQRLSIECISCQWSGQLKTYQLHLDQTHCSCKCSYCDETFDSIITRDQHIETTCSEAVVTCILESYGCDKKVLRSNLSKHYLSEEHQRIILLLVLQVIAIAITSNAQSAQFYTNIEQPMTDLTLATTTATSTSLVTDECNDQAEYINEAIDILARGTEALSEELQQINNESLEQSQQVEITHQNLLTLQSSVEESNASINAWNTNVAILQQDCSSLKQRVEESLWTSYDGTLVWKITDVQDRIVHARSERQASLYSPPFYSAPSGYKMCVRLYPIGDGNARGSYMSLFFVLMRGKNDSLLHFPFRYKVTFSLFDQSGGQNHIIDSFRPDIRSNSFQRPRSHMNIASGIPKFVQLSTIQQPDNPYVKADTMFIKIMVDFGDLPKTILPYALSLNPGIPTQCQQQMIEREIERQASSQSQSASQTHGTDHQGASKNSGSHGNRQQAGNKTIKQ